VDKKCKKYGHNFIYPPKYFVFSASMFTEIKIAQRHCIEIFYIGTDYGEIRCRRSQYSVFEQYVWLSL